MDAAERAALLNELRGIVESRERLMADVRSTVEETVLKVLREHRPGPAVPDYLAAATLQQGEEESLREGRPPGGVEFVAGAPPMTPVLRPLKQPIFDTLIAPEEGIRDEQEISLFTDHKAFPDGRRKMRADCNMTQPGMLGYPLEFDLSALELRFEKWAHPDDVARVLKGLRLNWFFGQNVPWLQLTASGFQPLIVLPHEVEDAQAEVRRQIAAFTQHAVWPAWRHDMETPDGKARRISSTESFSCRVACDVSELHGPVRLKVLMQDTLYACL